MLVLAAANAVEMVVMCMQLLTLKAMQCSSRQPVVAAISPWLAQVMMPVLVVVVGA
jgi:hypothetical protein